MFVKQSLHILKLIFFTVVLIFTCFSTSWAALTVTINGLDNSLEQSVRNGLSIDRQKENQRLTDTSIRALYIRSFDEIKRTLRANGYYQPVINQNLEQSGEDWVATYTIEPGDPVRIEKVQIEITDIQSADEILSTTISQFPLKSGDRLVHSLYESGKNAIQDSALSQGFFDGHWEQNRLEINTLDKTAAVILRYNAGTRYKLDTIFIPETVISPELINRLLTIQAGDFYDANKLVGTQVNLQNTNYFEQVVVRTGDINHDDKTIPVSIELTEKKKHAYRVGVGFGTDTGARLVGSWDTHYLNSKGHRQETDLRLSLVRNSLSSVYLIPFFKDLESELGIAASISREDTDTTISNKFDSSVQHLQQRWGWNETISLTYQYENYTVGSTSDSSHLLIPSVHYWKSVSDNPLYPRRGYRLSTQIKGSVKGLVSNVHFLQLQVRGKYIFPVGSNGRLIGRGELGALLTSKFSKLPTSLRFFAGGDHSIRGFDLNTLGPLDASGEVTGGSYLATGGVEYEHRLFGKWSAAVFSDFGNAFDEFSEPFEKSIGSGLRWQTPVGLFRFDVAVGISRDDTPIRLHIILGPDL